MPQPPFTKVSLKITFLILNWNLSGANELNQNGILVSNEGVVGSIDQLCDLFSPQEYSEKRKEYQEQKEKKEKVQAELEKAKKEQAPLRDKLEATRKSVQQLDHQIKKKVYQVNDHLAFFTQGLFWPSGIVVACVCLCVRVCV